MKTFQSHFSIPYFQGLSISAFIQDPDHDCGCGLEFFPNYRLDDGNLQNTSQERTVQTNGRKSDVEHGCKTLCQYDHE